MNQFKDIFRAWQIKAETLIRLSECAKQLKMYESSILLLKKALQFVWLTKDYDKELEIYDNLGNMENAFYYHEKYMKGEVEGEFTAIKQLSNKNIDFFENKQYSKQDKFSKLVMINISLPIKNIFESNDSSPVNTKPNLKDKSRKNNTDNSNTSKNNTSFHAFSDQNNPFSNQDHVFDLMKCQEEFLVVPLCDFDKMVTLKQIIIHKIVSFKSQL